MLNALTLSNLQLIVTFQNFCLQTGISPHFDRRIPAHRVQRVADRSVGPEVDGEFELGSPLGRFHQ